MMPSDPFKKNSRDLYLFARSRVMGHVVELVKARGVQIGVDIDPGRGPSEPVVHQIQLTYGRRTRLVSVDHETFMNDEFFKALVLHQLQAAIEELASAA